MTRRLSAGVLLILSVVGLSWADPVRTVVAGMAEVNALEPEGTTISLRFNEAVGIILPAVPLFIEGIELELRIPRAMQGAESSIAWAIYTSVTPKPGQGYDYTGTLLASQVLPSRVNMILRIPLLAGHSIRSSSFYTVIPTIVDSARYPVMFKLMQVGKGLTPSMEAAEFKLIVRPILGEQGGIRLAATSETDKSPEVSVFVDDKLTDVNDGLVILKKGLRNLRISATGYKDEVLAVTVEAGKISDVKLTLVPDAPRLTVFAPAGTLVTLNGVPLPPEEWPGMVLEVGDYTITCKIGDYSMSRKFTALRGKIYRVELTVELEFRSDN